MTAKSDGFGSVACRLAKIIMTWMRITATFMLTKTLRAEQVRESYWCECVRRTCIQRSPMALFPWSTQRVWNVALVWRLLRQARLNGTIPQVQWVSRSEKDEVLVGDCKATWPSLGRRNCGVRAK